MTAEQLALLTARSQLVTLGGDENTGDENTGDDIQRAVLGVIDRALQKHDITIHIFQDGEHHNGVNAKQNGRWLEHDDSFNTLLSATNYAFSLKRKLNASAVYTDWNGKEILENV